MQYENEIELMWCGHKSITESILQDFLVALDAGNIRVVENVEKCWIVNQWVKKGILLYLKHKKPKIMYDEYFDKIDLKTKGWSEDDFSKSGFRIVPGSVIRFGAYISSKVVIMPSFINVGAYVNEGSMIDTNATIGSCAYIGKNCHISDGVTIGGVLEPLQANPVIIEDNCFIGARSAITEGVIVKEGSVLAPGTFLSGSTPVVHKETGDITYGIIPEYSVIIPGSKRVTNDLNMYCVVIAKTVDEKTKGKTSINELLRM